MHVHSVKLNSVKHTSVKHTSVKLTKREAEVLGYVALGKRSREIADALFVSKRTVDFHLANVYGKLKVSNRMCACNAARERGLLTA